MSSRFREHMARLALAAFLLAGALTMLVACNTTAGVGQDLSAGGRAISNSADKVKQGM
ncbi:MAG TPA: entericidin A/B family lipoprotein [Acetobacteraceae bacterium]|jgi:predicted small secreted protein